MKVDDDQAIVDLQPYSVGVGWARIQRSSSKAEQSPFIGASTPAFRPKSWQTAMK